MCLFLLLFPNPFVERSSHITNAGCWEASSDDECLADDCVSKKRPAKGQQNSTKFCCCQGSLCNVDFRDGYDPANDTDLMDTRSRKSAL